MRVCLGHQRALPGHQLRPVQGWGDAAARRLHEPERPHEAAGRHQEKVERPQQTKSVVSQHSKGVEQPLQEERQLKLAPAEERGRRPTESRATDGMVH